MSTCTCGHGDLAAHFHMTPCPIKVRHLQSAPRGGGGMSERRRGDCPECGSSRALTTAGRIWAHTTWQLFAWGASRDLCPGTGRLPANRKKATR